MKCFVMDNLSRMVIFSSIRFLSFCFSHAAHALSPSHQMSHHSLRFFESSQYRLLIGRCGKCAQFKSRNALLMQSQFQFIKLTEVAQIGPKVTRKDQF